MLTERCLSRSRDVVRELWNQIAHSKHGSPTYRLGELGNVLHFVRLRVFVWKMEEMIKWIS